MLEVIRGVKNEAPFKYFEEISKIPRASGNEAEIANYLVEFAKGLGLKWYKDSANNVLILKDASIGRENEEPIMLQAHTDMVAEKNVATVHDFVNDAIKLVQEGNILRADGTTLGADDGFGVAIMMAVLADTSISNPKIECLFTSSEEIGLVGASKFDYSKIESRRMINLDSAEEDTVIIGCCGGVRTEFTIPIAKEQGNFKGIKITIGGLCGGHSGEDINKNRLNSNVLMGEVIKRINNKFSVKLAYICGGDKDNAIPRECESIIVPYDNFDACLELASNIESVLREEFIIKAKEDNGLFIKAECTNVDNCLNDEDTRKVLRVLSVPNAILRFRTVPPILPEKSRNLARIRTNDTSIEICFSSRSYYEEGLNESTSELDEVANEIDATTLHHERYPGWASSKDSKLVVDYQNAFYKVAGKKPEATLIHAGLECGLISGALEGLVAISVGCNVHDLHTPKETMELDSMDRVYEAVIEILK